MVEYNVESVSVVIETPTKTVRGNINISGFRNFSEFMEKDPCKYLKVYQTNNMKGNFCLIPKSDYNIYWPND